MDRNDVRELISLLDSEDAEIAEAAELNLANLGDDMVEELAMSVAGLGQQGQLFAADVFRELDGPAATQGLCTLLQSEHSQARESAALTLGALGMCATAPAVRKAYASLLALRSWPGEPEALAVRWALTALEVRQPVSGELTEKLRVGVPGPERVWPLSRLDDVLADLAAAEQVVLHFEVWRLDARGRVTATEHRPQAWDFDYDQPWETLVAKGFDACRRQLADLDATAEDLVATIAWVDRSDIHV